MGKTAFVFSGQGAQYPGMGKELYDASPAARSIFEISERIRPGTMKLCFSGTKEELTRTINTQPCLYTVDLAAAAALEEMGIAADAAAGFSLGEVAALTFAGRMSSEEGFAFVMERGQRMEDAAQKNPGTMAAVMRLSPPQTLQIASECGVYAANYNSPQQTVFSGEKEAIRMFCGRIKEAGGMALPLSVGGAFHSPLMKGAAAALAEVLRNTVYRSGAKCPVYANKTASPYPEDPEEAKKLMASQVESPVLWQQTIENMAADGFDTFIEVGAGSTLTGLIRKTVPHVTAFSIEKAADLKKEELRYVKK